jgi:hypothetical protein
LVPASLNETHAFTFTKNKVPNFSLINDHSEAELPVPAGHMADLEAGEA